MRGLADRPHAAASRRRALAILAAAAAACACVAPSGPGAAGDSGDARVALAGARATGVLDLGALVVDARGQRWEIGLGRDDLGLPPEFNSVQRPNRRLSHYRLRTEGHTTLTIARQGRDVRAASPITRCAARPEEAFAMAALTACCGPSGARGIRRGVALLDGRPRVLVQDEIEVSTPVDVRWAVHTRAAVEIAQDGEVARLSQGGEALEARLLAPAGARFQSEAVVIAAPQQPAAHTRRLAVRLLGDASHARIAVLLTPRAEELGSEPGSGGFKHARTAGSMPAVLPLDVWGQGGRWA